MRDLIMTLALVPCACGNSDPAHGFMAPPEIHYAACDCGAYVQGLTQDDLAAKWNAQMRRRARLDLVQILRAFAAPVIQQEGGAL